MTKPVRVRFAPSPTGTPHVGNIRTAIYDWLFARHTGGTFILRVEDTDLTRKVEGAVEVMMETLKWLGLDWDEGPDIGGDYGPYMQSQRLERYQQAVDRLIAQGDAYRCYCSPERLKQMRDEQTARKQPPGYDRLCRALTPEQCAENEANGIKPVVRFKMPLEGSVSYDDIVYGRVSFDLSTLDDFVILKSDGYPTYHLANVVDDSAMEISHVIRGDEWISSVPRHLSLYKALGLEPPQFAHTSVILGPGGGKLSKRHGAVSIMEYREMGYLPETMLNFLTMVGWSMDDKTEVMSREELVRNFVLERISKTGALFDTKKLEWMNGVYIRSLSPEEFVRRVMPFLEKNLPTEVKRPISEEYVGRMMPLVQERTRTLAEVPELVSFFFVEESGYDPETLIGKKMTREDALKVLEISRERLENSDKFDIETLENLLRPLAEELGLKAGQVFGTLRTATTGRTVAPPLFETMAVLGRDVCLDRIAAALDKLSVFSG